MMGAMAVMIMLRLGLRSWTQNKMKGKEAQLRQAGVIAGQAAASAFGGVGGGGGRSYPSRPLSASPTFQASCWSCASLSAS